MSGKGAHPFVSALLGHGSGEVPGQMIANLLLSGRVDTLPFVETVGRPANSPIWLASLGNVRALLAQNTETGVYTAVVRAVGCPGAAAEGLDQNATLIAALESYATVPNQGPRVRDITQADRDEIAAVLG